MFNRYYQEELTQLRDLGKEFSKAHPALAPMLSGPTTDPDVERLLEGVAFLTALMRQKLDDEFPEIIHGLIRLIWPHYLRPIPSTTIIAFNPKPSLKEPFTVPAGIYINSVPIEGTACTYKTCYEIELHPLSLVEASFEQPPGRPPSIRLILELNALTLSNWRPHALRFFIGGDYPHAADIYLLLRYYLNRIFITPVEKGNPLILTPESLKPVGFVHKEAVIPYLSHAYPGYRILQEYFILSEKFLFLDLVGWDKWQERGDGSRFEIRFELDNIPFPSPRIKKENFVLFASPAINVFPFDADPVRLDHKKTEYLIRPSCANSAHYQVFSVDNVTGFVQGTAEERVYTPFEAFNPKPLSGPVYHVTHRNSPIKEGFDVYLSVAYPREAGAPVMETLSIQLTCTNGFLPERLHPGDISKRTSSTPEFVEFKNIHHPTPYALPPLGTNLLWRLLSNLSLNYLSLERTENLKALLELYACLDTRDRKAILANRKRIEANRKRIEGIVKIESSDSSRLISGAIMRGKEIKLKMHQDHFASQGDLFLFGSVLDYFLGCYASINTYTRLFIEDVLKGDIYQWPARLGDRPLI
jgi:type VI secretion system protein ImpG